VGYLEKSLVPGETLAYKTGCHWIVMFWPLVGGLILGTVGFVLLASGWMGTKKGGSYPEMIGLGVAALVGGVVVIAGGIIRRAATEVGVSDKRVLIKTGLFSRRSIEVLLPKVESIGVDETLAGRIFGYGTVVIRGTGGTFETFGKIKQPNEFRRQVQAQLSRASVR
jgi:uncharacterized membrane protein YdbT with pleckstrin-like domain